MRNREGGVGVEVMPRVDALARYDVGTSSDDIWNSAVHGDDDCLPRCLRPGKARTRKHSEDNEVDEETRVVATPWEAEQEEPVGEVGCVRSRARPVLASMAEMTRSMRRLGRQWHGSSRRNKGEPSDEDS